MFERFDFICWAIKFATTTSDRSTLIPSPKDTMGPTIMFVVQSGHFNVNVIRLCHAWLSVRTARNLGTDKKDIRNFLLPHFAKQPELSVEAHTALIAKAALEGKLIKRELLHNEWAFFNILSLMLNTLSKSCSCFYTLHQFKQDCLQIALSTTKRVIAIKVSAKRFDYCQTFLIRALTSSFHEAGAHSARISRAPCAPRIARATSTARAPRTPFSAPTAACPARLTRPQTAQEPETACPRGTDVRSAL